jgi:hypothetical protein
MKSRICLIIVCLVVGLGTDYSDTGVGPGREYTYAVASRDGAGQVGN